MARKRQKVTTTHKMWRKQHQTWRSRRYCIAALTALSDIPLSSKYSGSLLGSAGASVAVHVTISHAAVTVRAERPHRVVETRPSL